MAILAFWVIVGGFFLGSQMLNVERHLIGYAGTGLILLAQVYTVRKRYPKILKFGTLKGWMAAHRVMTLTGAGLVIIHTGSSEMPQGIALITAVIMMVTTLSGVVGAYIHNHAIRERAALRQSLAQQGLSKQAIEDELYLISFSEATFRDWKKIHQPITMAFFAALFIHVLSMIYYGGILQRG